MCFPERASQNYVSHVALWRTSYGVQCRMWFIQILDNDWFPPPWEVTSLNLLLSLGIAQWKININSYLLSCFAFSSARCSSRGLCWKLLSITLCLRGSTCNLGYLLRRSPAIRIAIFSTVPSSLNSNICLRYSHLRTHCSLQYAHPAIGSIFGGVLPMLCARGHGGHQPGQLLHQE